MEIKRVATLYRVSTKGQLDGDDIPTQRKLCLDFIEKQEDWEFVKEYVEKGVSGYKVSATDRDIIQKAKIDAENGLFDVLLVYMFDRLGRRDDETPFVLEWFVNQGVEMWSVKEGQQKIEDHTDKLVNYLRFWQSSGESRKTSIRVNDKHAEMVKDGVYRGGTVPYGYKTLNSGVLNKKGKDLLKVVIDEEKAMIVRMMYDLVLEEGYGQNRIAGLLNTKGYPSKTGKKWTSAAVNNVLRNPMYKGYMTYNRGKKNEVTSNEKLEDLVIVDEEIWIKVQKIREARSPENVKNKDEKNVITTTKGPLLLVGLINCGHCGYPLTTTYNKKTYVRKDGTKRVTREAKYRCSGKAQMKAECDGQTIYASKKIEGIVLDELFEYLQQLNKINLTKEIQKLKKQNTNNEVVALRKLEKELETATTQLLKLNEEVIKSVMGESDFKPAILNNLIEKKELELKELKELLEEAKQELESKKVELFELEDLQKYIPVWRDVFEKATTEKKKMMLATVIERILVKKEEVEITFKINMNQFVKNGAVKATKEDSQLS
jgi:site-specific DNA recombinase